MRQPLLDGLTLRPVRDDDAASLTDLIDRSFQEYPGCVLDLDGVDRDLRQPATEAARNGGRWWVLDHGGVVMGTVAAGRPDDAARVELKRLYLDAALRGRGLGTRLINRVEEHAAGLGAIEVELWSDTRFEAAHERYQRLGYLPTDGTRELHDPSNTTEAHYRRAITPATPVAIASWTGSEHAAAGARTLLPDGEVLAGWWTTSGSDPRDRAPDVLLEVDASWRPRRLEWRMADGPVQGRTSDGDGRWWRAGDTDRSAAGATDLAPFWHPVVAAVAARRLTLGLGEHRDLTLLTDPAAPLAETVTIARTGSTGWRFGARGGPGTEVVVGPDGLAERIGDTWLRGDLVTAGSTPPR